ncbi:accessory gland protein Acp63F-like [Drosophila ficusphila]|uniref:accessory gland protein Acp63F-like n=1 Tax=Drosophila ficusphila TaxID=30025 RepID=UPI0007E6CFBA|nr:accessory gland protein Acp63F-like [Drosophila ficusphila]
MRNLSFVFLLAVFVLETNGKCSNYVLLNYYPTCGIAADCYFYGDNYSVVDNQNCRRKEKGLPPFLETKDGECPTDKPRCTYIKN